MSITGLILLVAFLIFMTRSKPSMGGDRKGMNITIVPPTLGALVTWAIVCVAMVAGLVIFAVSR